MISFFNLLMYIRKLPYLKTEVESARNKFKKKHYFYYISISVYICIHISISYTYTFIYICRKLFVILVFLQKAGL